MVYAFMMHRSSGTRGFTLIELSIVLVIIGLIVGGVLVGQDLIKAARMRAQISQIEQYDSTANTFRNKYGGLPGDLRNGGNSFDGTTDVPASGGNCANAAPGNAVFEDCAGNRALFSGEPAAFWRQLYLSNMIVDSITNTVLIGGTSAVPAVPPPSAFPRVFPSAKLGNGNYVIVYTGAMGIPQPGMAGTNIYRIAGLLSLNAPGIGQPAFINSLTPLEAFQFDAKKDDGVWNTGVVQAADATGAGWFNLNVDTATLNANNCISGAVVATGAYNTNTANGNRSLCQVLIRSSF
jgi:prepilin-type N-terminal cleavage/methylation domain-containing protein